MENEIQNETEVIGKRKFTERHAQWSLGIISFTESSFLPIFTDPFLVAMVLADSKQWLRYAIVVSVTSVLGGLFGYFLGAVFFELIGAKMIAAYNLEGVFNKAVDAFDSNAFVFTLVGAVTPIPYKIVALVAGFLKINLALFVAASILGRFFRYILVAYVSKVFGEHALKKITTRYGKVGIAASIGALAYLFYLFVA